MTHFTDVDLARWREAGPGEDRARVIAHVAECAPCASRYAAAIRAQPRAAEPAGDVQEFVATGHQIGGRAAAAAAPLWKRPWIVSLAAAAALAIAFAVPRFLPRDRPDAPVLRGSSVSTLTPAGIVARRDLRFVWSTGLSAERFRLEIGDAAGSVYSTEAAASPWTMPDAARDRLRPDVEYWWTVTVLDATGAAVTTSPRRTFALAP
jgi:hypothetical protein